MDDNIEVAALSLSTQNNSVRFDKDLGACQGYTIQIIPYTKQNLDGELDHIDVETKAAIVNYEKVSKYIYVYMDECITIVLYFIDQIRAGGQWRYAAQPRAECEQSGLQQSLPDDLRAFQLPDQRRRAQHLCGEVCGKLSRSRVSGGSRATLAVHQVHLQRSALQCGWAIGEEDRNGSTAGNSNVLYVSI